MYQFPARALSLPIYYLIVDFPFALTPAARHNGGIYSQPQSAGRYNSNGTTRLIVAHRHAAPAPSKNASLEPQPQFHSLRAPPLSCPHFHNLHKVWLHRMPRNVLVVLYIWIAFDVRTMCIWGLRMCTLLARISRSPSQFWRRNRDLRWGLHIFHISATRSIALNCEYASNVAVFVSCM